MANLPDGTLYGTVVAQFIQAVADTADVDRDPDSAPMIGTITFTPAATRVALPTAIPNPVTMFQKPIMATLDSEGYLVGPDGQRGVRLVASDSPGSPTDFTYSVQANLSGVSPFSFNFFLDAGSVVDLTSVIPAGLNPGFLTPTDDLVAGFVSTPGTKTNDELTNTIDAAIAAAIASLPPGANLTDEAGVLVSSRLDNGTGDVILALLGDSTGNGDTDWFRLAIGSIATEYPSLRILYTLWDHAAQDYPAFTTVQAGDYSETGGLTVDDTFNRVGELIGSGTPPWTGSIERWTTDGSKAVCGGTGTMLAPGDTASDDFTARFLDVTLDTTGAAALKEHRFYTKYVSSSAHVFLSVTVGTSGATTATLWKRIGGTASTMVGSTSLGLSAGAVHTFDVIITQDGDDITAVVNGVELAGTLAAGDATALQAGTAVGFSAQSANAALPSFTIGAVQAETPVVGSGQTLTVYNGSYPGSTLAYQSDRLEIMLPVAPDVVILSSSHNYGTGGTAPYIAAVEALVDDIETMHPGARMVASSQNPEFPGTSSTTAGIAAHLARLTELRIVANRNNWGYVPVLEAYRAQPDGGDSFVGNDGIHPIVSNPPNGSTFWAGVFIDWLARHAV